MSDLATLVAVLAAAGVAFELIKQAPSIIWTFHDARVSRRLTPDFLYTRRDLVTAISTAIDRTAEPTVGPNLRDKLALTVIEDIDAGRLPPVDLTPPDRRKARR